MTYEDDDLARRIEVCNLDGPTATALVLGCSIEYFKRKILTDPLFGKLVEERPERFGEKYYYHTDSVSSYVEVKREKRALLDSERKSHLIRWIKPSSSR